MGTGNTNSYWVASKESIPVFWKYAIAIGACEAIALAIGLLSYSEGNLWLDSPFRNPPVILYLFMGIAMALVWKDRSVKIKKARGLYLFSIQLLLNLVWYILYFQLRLPGWAFVESVIMIGFILATISEFMRIDRLAAWMMLPYIPWVCSVAVLSASHWQISL
jgi:tryptophan-rich sensory protein